MKILLNSLPKSGTNMVQKCLGLTSLSYSGRSLAASSCFGKHAVAKKILRMPNVGEVPVVIGLEAPLAVSPQWLRSYLHSARGYVSGHGAYSDHYHAILQAEGYKVIQVVRHPCAVLVSWANYIAEPGYYWKKAHRFLAGMDFPDRINFLLYGGGDDADCEFYYRGFREVLSQVGGWLDTGDVLAVRYEDLVGEQGGGDNGIQRRTIADIFKYIGLPSDEQIVESVAGNLYGGTHTFRKGSIDSWKDAIDNELALQIYDELSGLPWLSRLGYF